MKILVTGASGLLGNKIISLASSQGHETLGTHNLHLPEEPSKSRRINLVDRRAVKSLFSDFGPDVVIHTASMTDVDQCETDPPLAMKTNGELPGIIADTCNELGCFLVHVSTDYVFDGKHGNYSENAAPNPINIYGRSKLMGEREVSRRARTFCIARTSSIFGWGRAHRSNFATWLCQKLRRMEKVSAVTDQYVSPTLNTDLASMLLEIAERRLNGLFHLSGATRISRYDFAVRLARTFSLNESLILPVKVESMNWKAKRPRDSSLNVSKAMETLNNKPVTIEESLKQFVLEAPKQ